MNLRLFISALALTLSSLITPVKSQDLDFIDILSAGTADAELYLNEYINPFMKGFGYGFSNGWYNTAKPHRPLGLDITATVNAAFVPDKDLLFNFQGFENVQVESGSDQLPTIFGPKTETVLSFNTTSEVNYIDPDPASPTFGELVRSEEALTGEFDAPDGLDLDEEIGSSFVPVPMVQLGIGLIKRTELKIRWLPPISTDDFDFSFYGFGIMHDFKQWTPGISHLPFDMSGFIGWTRLNAETDFSGANSSQVGGGENQRAKYEVTSLTLQVVASKKLSILTVYGGFGYTINNSSLGLLGTYIIEGETDITLEDGSLETVQSSTDPQEDPIDLNFKSTSPRATLGLRLKLLILTLHADYTIQEYNTLTAGIGFSIR